MKSKTIFIISGICLVALLTIVVFTQYISVTNQEVRLSNQFDAEQQKIEMVYDNMWKTIQQTVGLVDEIVDNGENYLLIINGHEFHQPKNYFKKESLDVDKSEPYVPSSQIIEFDYDTYKLAISTMSFFTDTYVKDDNFLKKLDMKVGEVENYRQKTIDMLHHFNEGNLNISIEEAIDILDVEKLSIVYIQAKNTLKKDRTA